MSITASACNPKKKTPDNKPQNIAVNADALEAEFIDIFNLNSTDSYDIKVFNKEQDKVVIKDFCANLAAANFAQAKADKFVNYLKTQKTNADIDNLTTFKSIISSFFELEFTSDDAGIFAEAYFRALINSLNNASIYDKSISILNGYTANFSEADKNIFDVYAKPYTAMEIYGKDFYIPNTADLTEPEYNNAKTMIDSVSGGNADKQILAYADAKALLQKNELYVNKNCCFNLRKYVFMFSSNLMDNNQFISDPVRQDAINKYYRITDITDAFKEWCKAYAHNGYTAENSALTYISNLLNTYKSDVITDTEITTPNSVTDMSKIWVKDTISILDSDLKKQYDIAFDYQNYAEAIYVATNLAIEKESNRYAVLKDNVVLSKSLPLVKNASAVLYKGFQTVYGSSNSLYAIIKNEYSANDISAIISSMKSVVNEMNTFFIQNNEGIKQLTAEISAIDLSNYSSDVKKRVQDYCNFLNVSADISNDTAIIANNIIDCADVTIINGLLSFKSDTAIGENLAIYGAKFAYNFMQKYNAETACNAFMNIYDKLTVSYQVQLLKRIYGFLQFGDANADKTAFENYINVNDYLQSIKDKCDYQTNYNLIKEIYPEITVTIGENEFEDNIKINEFVTATENVLSEKSVIIRTITADYLKSTLTTYFKTATKFMTLKDMTPATDNGTNYSALVAEINRIGTELEIAGLRESIVSTALEINKFLNQKLTIDVTALFENAETLNVDETKEIKLPENRNTLTVVYKITPAVNGNFTFIAPEKYVSAYYKDGVKIDLMFMPDNSTINDYPAYSIKTNLQAGITYYFVITVDGDYTFKLTSI